MQTCVKAHELGATLDKESPISFVHNGAVDNAVVAFRRKLANGLLTIRARGYDTGERIGNISEAVKSSFLITCVYFMEANQAINRLTREEMATRKHYNWGLIEVDFGECFPFEEVNTSVHVIAADLTQVVWAIFSAEARASMAAFEKLGTSLIARKSITWCRTRQ
jgi:hypothetical protein